jgi:hypothetical protein
MSWNRDRLRQIAQIRFMSETRERKSANIACRSVRSAIESLLGVSRKRRCAAYGTATRPCLLAAGAPPCAAGEPGWTRNIATGKLHFRVTASPAVKCARGIATSVLNARRCRPRARRSIASTRLVGIRAASTARRDNVHREIRNLADRGGTEAEVLLGHLHGKAA